MVYLLSYRSEVPEKFEKYEAMVTAKFGTRISCIRCDNGGEYSSRQCIEFCKSKEGVCAATYILNRTPTRVLKVGCPADLWHGYLWRKQNHVMLRKKQPEKLQDFDTCFVAALSRGILPSELPETFEEGLESRWRTAIDAEHHILEKNNVWELVSEPHGENIIDSKWDFTEKEVLGQNIKNARLVARGYFQYSKTVEEV
ncbi:hypothetical protein PR048_004702 [Dryococelus australis]|uniref:Integrase catalytic domain-containing protein n=1 Tax=Dryococelus australis TaxID=614101 RepID=A0ABQ9I642_9NEOP|nr:hypothetical protein PR048_004702 [Dryococelus australis]